MKIAQNEDTRHGIVNFSFERCLNLEKMDIIEADLMHKTLYKRISRLIHLSFFVLFLNSCSEKAEIDYSYFSSIIIEDFSSNKDARIFFDSFDIINLNDKDYNLGGFCLDQQTNRLHISFHEKTVEYCKTGVILHGLTDLKLSSFLFPRNSKLYFFNNHSIDGFFREEEDGVSIWVNYKNENSYYMLRFFRDEEVTSFPGFENLYKIFSDYFNWNTV